MPGHNEFRMVEPPYKFIADGLKAGEVVPFLGAAASAVYRPTGVRWEPGKPFVPFGGELALSLAEAANYPKADAAATAALSDILGVVLNMAASIVPDRAEAALAPVLHKHINSFPGLALIASWAEHVQGHRRAVDRELRQCFAVNCTPGLLHASLAGVTGTMIYITTNYDDMLEKALEPRKPHLIVDRGGDRGLLVAVAGGRLQPVKDTGKDLYDLLNDPKTGLPSHPIVFKMHGSVDKTNAGNDSYLITEEDYVDFLGRAGGRYLPPYIDGQLTGKDFLFLGYSLEDWNVRVILRKLLKRPAGADVRFWAIVRGRSDAEQEVWQARNLNIYPMDLLVFTRELAKYL